LLIVYAYYVRVLSRCDQIPEKGNLKEERFILLMVSEVSVHYGREGMVEQLTS
jgi:hypothetical protein